MTARSVAVVGPTASGKTGRAVDLAKVLGGEIISADSRQVYRQMDLGTGKDLEDYDGVPYHLIDIRDAGEKYNLHDYLKDFAVAWDDITSRGKVPVICGGSGMYVESALSGLRLPDVPENTRLRESLEGKTLIELEEILKGYRSLHNITDLDTAQRAIRAIEIEQYYLDNPDKAISADRSKTGALDALVIGVEIDRESRRRRITERLHARLDSGMTDEVRRLLDAGIEPENLIYYGLEYKFLTLHAIGEMSYQDMVKGLETAIHQFAKRQMTWFRGMERRGFKIHWLPYDMGRQEFVDAVLELL